MEVKKPVTKPEMCRKSSMKRKPPMVKQTKGSLLRMIKTNPFFAVDEKTKQELGITDTELKRIGHIGMVKSTLSLISKVKQINSESELKEPPKEARFSTQKNKSKQCLRRSMSADRFHNQNNLPPSNLSQTFSLEDLPNESKLKNVNVTPSSKPKAVFFKTPQTYRNVFEIPSTNGTIYQSRFRCSTPGDIKGRLNDWLSKRGKPLGSYHHLKCFGIPQEEIEEEKENIDSQCQLEEAKGQSNIEINYDNVAKDALHDLLVLIQEGYPYDRCNEWLNMIKRKCEAVEEMPTYWECRAALEEINENLPNAISCYRTAIIKGAEVKTIDESLNLLLEKFSLLNIDSNVVLKESKAKPKIILDARNTFKSTIIQFAVHERDTKKKENGNSYEPKLYVTPVRRSRRLSTQQKTPSAIKLFSTVKDIEESNEYSFKKNDFLSVRFN